MKLIKRYGSEKIEYDIADDEAKIINAFLTNPNKTTHLNFRGEALKANQLEVTKDSQVKSERKKTLYSDAELEIWEKEIFGENWEQGELVRNTFEEYLSDVGAIVVNKTYPDGAVKDSIKYQLLIDKWTALGYARRRRDKLKGFPKQNEWLAKIREGRKKLLDKMDIKTVLNIETDQQRLNEIETIDVSEPHQGVNLADIGF